MKDEFDRILNINLLQALYKIIYTAYKEGNKVAVVTGMESLLTDVTAVCNKNGIR